MSRSLRFFLLFLFILSLDRLTKNWVMGFPEGEGLEVLSGFFYLTYVRNTGAAFGLLKGRTELLAVISVLFITGAAVYFIRSARARGGQGSPAKGPVAVSGLAWTLVVAGAAGNLIDRVLYGFVVDLVDLRVVPQLVFGSGSEALRIVWTSWPVFNAADVAICAGTALLAYDLFKKSSMKAV